MIIFRFRRCPRYSVAESATEAQMARGTMLISSAVMALCVNSAVASDSGKIEEAAHGAYVTAINSNNVDILLADLTDDIVYQSPGEPEIIGNFIPTRSSPAASRKCRTRRERCRPPH